MSTAHCLATILQQAGESQNLYLRQKIAGFWHSYLWQQIRSLCYWESYIIEVALRPRPILNQPINYGWRSELFI